MMRKVWLICTLSMMTAVLFAGKTTFLAHFDKLTDPDLCAGGGISDAYKVITSHHAGFRFRTRGGATGGIDFDRPGIFVEFPSKGNIDLKQGTMNFLLQMDNWQQSDGEFTLISVGNEFKVLRAAGGRNFLTFSAGGSAVKAALPTAQGKWTLVTLVWGKQGKGIYVDGKPAAKGAYAYIPAKGDNTLQLTIGSRNNKKGVRCFFDELRILDFPQKPAVIAQDAQLILKEKTRFKISTANWADAAIVPQKQAPAKSTAAVLTGDKIKAVYTVDPIKIDGVMDDPAWKQAIPLPQLLLRNGKPQAQKSDIRILYDSKYIYFGVTLAEPVMKELRAERDQHDLEISNDDCIEILLDSGNSPQRTFHFIVNALGTLYDSRNDNPTFYNSRNSIIRTQRGKDFWSVEMAIPFREIYGPRPPWPGLQWSLRMARERYAGVKRGPELSTFPRCPRGPLNARDYMASLEFTGAAGQSSTLNVQIEDKKFSIGNNTVKMTLANLSGKDMALLVRCKPLYGMSGSRDGYDNFRKTVNIKAGAEVTVPISFNVQSPDTSAVSIQVEQNSSILWCGSIASGYNPLEENDKEVAAMLAAFRRNALLWEEFSPEIAAALHKNYKQVNDVRRIFEQMKIVASPNVPDDETSRYVNLINGLKKYCKDRAILLWKTDPWSDASPDEQPLKLEQPQLYFRLGSNGFAIESLAAASGIPHYNGDWRFAVEELFDSKGRPLNRDRLTIYELPYVRDTVGDKVIDPLIENDGNIFTLPIGTARRFWFVFNSRNIPPGKYKGKITIKPVDILAVPRGDWLTIPITVEILPFAYPATADWPLDAFLWGSTGFVDENPTLKIMDESHIKWVWSDWLRYSIGVHHHNIGYKVFNPSGFPPGGFFREENIYANDRFLHEARERGLKIFFGWGTTANEVWLRKFSEHLFKIGFTWDDFMFYGMFDEVTIRTMDSTRRLLDEGKKVSDKIRWFATVVYTPPPNGLSWEQWDKVSKEVKNFCYLEYNFLTDPYQKWHRKTLDPARAAETQEFIRKHPDMNHWYYRCSIADPLPVLDYHRMGPLAAKRYGVSGVAYWATSANRGRQFKLDGKNVYTFADSWFDIRNPDATYVHGLLFWHPQKCLIKTRRFMALTIGLEDYYLFDKLSKMPQLPAKYADLVSKETLDKLLDSGSWNIVNNWRRRAEDALAELEKRNK